MYIVAGQLPADAQGILWVLDDFLKVQYGVEPSGFPNPPVGGLARCLVGGCVLARILDWQQRSPKDLDAFGVGFFDDLHISGDEFIGRYLLVADVVDAFHQNQVRHVRP